MDSEPALYNSGNLGIWQDRIVKEGLVIKTTSVTAWEIKVVTNAFAWLGMLVVASAFVFKFAAGVDHIDAALAILAASFGLSFLIGPFKLVVRADGRDVVIAKGFKGKLDRIASFVEQAADHKVAAPPKN